MGTGNPGLVHLLSSLPATELCTTPAQCFAPERRHHQGWTRGTPTVCFFLAQNTFIRKLMSGKKLSVLVMPTAIRSTSNFSLVLFQISWGRNSISAANFILFSLDKFSELVDYTRQCVWTFTPTLPTYIYRHTIETHTYIQTYIHTHSRLSRWCILQKCLKGYFLLKNKIWLIIFQVWTRP